MSGVRTGPDADPALPSSVCFRVTRACNARCGFCLAPRNGSHPSGEVLAQRLDWVLDRGVREVHFCGGEPTVHPALPTLIRHVRSRGARTRVTTNGLVLPDEVLSGLAEAGSRVKVSLHGDRAHHDAMLGVPAFDRTTHTLRRLLAARVPTSVQCTAVSGGEAQLDGVIAFCLETGVRRLSVLPFIPRGDGARSRERYELGPAERRHLREALKRRRGPLLARGLELRWLDFRTRSVVVVDADGRVVREGASERLDVALARIPCAGG